MTYAKGVICSAMPTKQKTFDAVPACQHFPVRDNVPYLLRYQQLFEFWVDVLDSITKHQLLSQH
jgi:hypothetical protein